MSQHINLWFRFLWQLPCVVSATLSLIDVALVSHSTISILETVDRNTK